MVGDGRGLHGQWAGTCMVTFGLSQHRTEDLVVMVLAVRSLKCQEADGLRSYESPKMKNTHKHV